MQEDLMDIMPEAIPQSRTVKLDRFTRSPDWKLGETALQSKSKDMQAESGDPNIMGILFHRTIQCNREGTSPGSFHMTLQRTLCICQILLNGWRKSEIDDSPNLHPFCHALKGIISILNKLKISSLVISAAHKVMMLHRHSTILLTVAIITFAGFWISSSFWVVLLGSTM